MLKQILWTLAAVLLLGLSGGARDSSVGFYLGYDDGSGLKGPSQGSGFSNGGSLGNFAPWDGDEFLFPSNNPFTPPPNDLPGPPAPPSNIGDDGNPGSSHLPTFNDPGSTSGGTPPNCPGPPPDVPPPSVPEPTTLVLFGTGLAGLVGERLGNRRKS